MTLRTPIVRARLAALIACSLIAAIAPLSAAAEPGIAPGSGAVVVAGAPLLVRAAPGWDAAVAYEIADGSAVTVWDAAQAAPDGTWWYPVDGGFVPVEAVTSLAAPDGGVALAQEAAPGAGEGWVAPAAPEGWVDPTTGEWVEPAAEEWVDPAATEYVAPAAEEWVEPAAQEGWVDPSTGEWVEPAAQEGWVDPTTGDWVEPAAAAGAPPAEGWAAPAPAETVDPNAGGPEPGGEPLGTAYIAGSGGAGAACRAGPERGAERLAVLAEGEAVAVRGAAVGAWQPVNCAGVGGYVHGSLIAWEPAAASWEEAQRRRGQDGGGGGNRGGGGNAGAASASGQQVASFAMRYEGYPYVWGAAGPDAFDCSGFTKFVYQNALGLDISQDLFQQAALGTPVGRDELQPGDMVFFQNTYRPGLSHNGVYVGDGLMIHAENEQTGVKVSDITSDYYSSRWYGAVRLT